MNKIFEVLEKNFHSSHTYRASRFLIQKKSFVRFIPKLKKPKVEIIWTEECDCPDCSSSILKNDFEKLGFKWVINGSHCRSTDEALSLIKDQKKKKIFLYNLDWFVKEKHS